MRILSLIIPIATTTADLFYLPVPCRGIVKKAYMAHDQETDTDEVVTLMRGATAVNAITPAANATAEGVSVEGTPDTTNKDLIFDPASTTAANRVIRISIPNTFDAGGNLGLTIFYDESAAVEQDASEA
jgi:hypothetical protein